ncbi:hypothetical protein [Sphingomonas sp. R86520]|uniref:hypothetical protein n=1 Tax=Sphingomonas sp. R86520 TaxID=3093859 RepID=UPI0036D3EFFB
MAGTPVINIADARGLVVVGRARVGRPHAPNPNHRARRGPHDGSIKPGWLCPVQRDASGVWGTTMNIRGEKPMSVPNQPQPMILPRDFTDHGPSVEDLAREFAKQDVAASEALIEKLATQAIRQWRLDDATFWQRVKFQARMFRAQASSAASAGKR